MMVLVQVQERALCAVSSNTEGTCSRLGDYRHVRFFSSHPIHPRFHLALDNSPCTTYVEDTAGHDSVEHDIIFKRPYDSPQSSFAYLPICYMRLEGVVCSLWQ